MVRGHDVAYHGMQLLQQVQMHVRGRGWRTLSEVALLCVGLGLAALSSKVKVWRSGRRLPEVPPQLHWGLSLLLGSGVDASQVLELKGDIPIMAFWSQESYSRHHL
eukprot:TRINITY_DN81400_c0_g1_i1.p1 TRINITY_DN81400_c0_g1~~TRINITY_DN81400_c0_g1_i1.p1  ORF type:complete len:116 (+),score=16.73 TRINITY_DN81400_c0_g1_i1:33-350(+)